MSRVMPGYNTFVPEIVAFGRDVVDLLPHPSDLLERLIGHLQYCMIGSCVCEWSVQNPASLVTLA